MSNNEDKEPNVINVQLTAPDVGVLTLMYQFAVEFMITNNAPIDIVKHFNSHARPIFEQILEKAQIKVNEGTLNDIVKDLKIKFKDEPPKPNV